MQPGSPRKGGRATDSLRGLSPTTSPHRVHHSLTATGAFTVAVMPTIGCTPTAAQGVPKGHDSIEHVGVGQRQMGHAFRDRVRELEAATGAVAPSNVYQEWTFKWVAQADIGDIQRSYAQ